MHLFVCVGEKRPPCALLYTTLPALSLFLSVLRHYDFAGAQGDPQQAAAAEAKGAAAATGHQTCRAAGEQVCVCVCVYLYI